MKNEQLQLPDRLVSLSLTGALYNSYAPLEQLSKQIRRAVLNGDVKRLDRLWTNLQARYPVSDLTPCLVSAEPNSKQTHLALAVEQKNVQVVRWLIDQGAEDGGLTKTADGDTVLHLAAANDAAEIIALYHFSFCDEYDDPENDLMFIDWTNSRGASALCVACSKNSEASAKMLLELGASVDLVDCEGNTPLHYAAAYGNANLVKLLIHRGANAFTKNDLGYTASDFAYSFEVEQQIQNTVRAVLEANKRARKPKLHLPSLSSGAKPSPDGPSSGEFEEPPLEPPKLGSPAMHPPPSSPFVPKALKLQAVAIPQSPVTPGPTSASTPRAARTLPTPPSIKSPSCGLPQSSPKLDPQSSRALQRIFARDQNAQAGFQTSTAIRSVMSPVAMGSVATAGLASPLKLANPPISVRSIPMQRRHRSSSTESLSYGSSMSSASQLLSPSTSPVLGLGISTSAAPLPPSPASPLPPPPLSAKSATSSIMSRFTRSTTHTGTTTSTPPPSSTANDYNFIHQRFKGPKHHASLVDLRTSAAAPSSTSSAPPLTPTIKTPTAIHFGRSRTRAGT